MDGAFGVSSKKIRRPLLLTLSLALLVALGVAGLKLRAFIIYKNTHSTFAVPEPFMKKVEAHLYKVIKRSSVYEFLRKSYYTFGVPRKGLIHIGARYAEELEFYQDHNVEKILWIEADPEAEEKLRAAVAKHPGSRVEMFAASNENGYTKFYQTSNSGHSSSILKLKNHLLHYPYITEVKALDVPQYRLDDFLSKQEREQYNVIVMDIQGAELIALEGAVETLKTTDAIIAETNYDELYEGGVLIADLDAFLAQHGFTRVESISVAYYTGDALYVKNHLFKPRT